MPRWVLTSCQPLLRCYQPRCHSQLAINTDLAFFLSHPPAPPIPLLCVKAHGLEETQRRLERKSDWWRLDTRAFQPWSRGTPGAILHLQDCLGSSFLSSLARSWRNLLPSQGYMEPTLAIRQQHIKTVLSILNGIYNILCVKINSP